MSFNQVENAILAEAIANLKPQYESVYGHFYIGKSVKFIIIDDGQNKGKLTIGKTIDGVVVPDPSITPVDCYNLIRDSEGLAVAVNRIFYQREFPYHQPSFAT